MRLTRVFSRRMVMLASALALAGSGVPALGDEYKDRVNAPLKGVGDDKRSDKVLLPLLAAMEAPPAVVKSQAQAALVGSQGPGWSELQSWSQRAPQTAVLDAIAKVAKEEDRSKAFAFAQQYGAEIPELDLISKGMYTELGEPELLSAARHLYMPALERTGILVHVEASRLNEGGKTYEALKLLNDWLFVCRQMADRPFLREKKWAMESMRLSLERMRDVIHVDLKRDKHGMDVAKVLEINKRLKDRRGFLSIERIRLPDAEFVGREQLVSAIMGSDGKPSTQSFGPTLARAASSERPLRLFSASAFWDGVREKHAGARETRDMLKMVEGDWTKRWDLDFFDRVLTTASDYRRRVATTPKFAALQLGLGDVESLLGLRMELKLELVGTRSALGAYGFFLRNKAFPRTIASARPDFVEAVDKDPWSREGKDLEFFVPQRDTPKDADGKPKPHVLEIYAPDPTPRFKVPLGDDVFVIYSLGPDEDRGNANFATQTRTGVPGDYVLFPPLLSLYRQRLVELNELK
jgi:hypothetical protein